MLRRQQRTQRDIRRAVVALERAHMVAKNTLFEVASAILTREGFQVVSTAQYGAVMRRIDELTASTAQQPEPEAERTRETVGATR